MFTVLIIEDLLIVRDLFKNIINNIDNFKVVDTAKDPYEAREKIKKIEPDLVIIDINTSKMDGITFLNNLMRLHPMPAIITSDNIEHKINVMKSGAIGFILKDKEIQNNLKLKQNLTALFLEITNNLYKYQKIKPKVEINLAYSTKYKIKKISTNIHEKKNHPDLLIKNIPLLHKGDKIIGIGSSTGGVESLMKIFKVLPLNLPPIVITQHIPYGFSGSFAQRLNEYSQLKVIEVETDTILKSGSAYLAPGNMHLVISKSGSNYVGKLLDGKKISRHKPSVNVMFRSLNNCAGAGVMAIMMTGMGDDGKIAIKELFDNNAYTVAQNEESCVVFGMPQQAIKAGAIKDICHLNDIAQCIVDFSLDKRG